MRTTHFHHHCHGKVRHPSREMAESSLAGLLAKRNEPKRRSKRLAVYWCGTCGCYHVGHRRIGAMPKES